MTVALPPGGAQGAAAACARVYVPGQNLPIYRPPLVAADAELGANGPAITVSAKRELWSTGGVDELRVVVRMKAEETGGNWSKAEGSRTYLLFRGASGCRVNAQLLPGNFDSNGYLARALHPDPLSLAPGNTGVNASFVAAYRVYDDQPGRDIGVYTGVVVQTRAFNVHFTS